MTVSEDLRDLQVTITPDRVGVLELRRPPNNFFDEDLLHRLAEAADKLSQGDDARVILLCSEGRNFCAGAQHGHEPSESARPAPHVYASASRLLAQPLPIVAAVQGAAVGGGLGLALIADFRVASPASTFSANFAQLGTHHGFGISATLPRVVGQQAALDLLYTGRRLRGQEAHSLGLCDRLSEDVRGEALALATSIASSAPLAIRAIRATMRRELVETFTAATDLESAQQDLLGETMDWKEGVAAMAQRRPPNFVGR